MGMGATSVVEFSGVRKLTGALIMKLNNGHWDSVHLTRGWITTEASTKTVTRAIGSCNLPVAARTM